MTKNGEPITIQPPENPIICSPYLEPDKHWFYDLKTGIPRRNLGRRPASYWYRTERTGASEAQMRMFGTQETADELPLVNALRDDVRRWRESDYEGASRTTKQLFRHWKREDRARKLFFCQVEAVETIIYLREILEAGRKPRWKTKLKPEEYRLLLEGKNPRPVDWTGKVAQFPRLIDKPNEDDLKPLIRYGCKMATGSGKTILMAMLITWSFCNRGLNAADTRYSRRVLVACPNLTIKERLQVLMPGSLDNYYDQFDLVPSSLRPELNKGKVLVTNWHFLGPTSVHSEGGKSWIIVNKGEESPEAFAKNRLVDLWDDEPLMVLNDEGHHAYRPAPVSPDEKISADERAEREQATVWVSGLDKINAACGISFCVDLSATPFYIHGSGYVEGSPFPWIVSDFGLVDAIESGITKIPRLPAMDNTGRPDPKYFKLWEYIYRNLKPGDKLTGGKPKPAVVYREAEDALLTLAGEWKERFEQMQEAAPGQERIPPVMILVCDNTSIADYFHRQISGEESVEVEEVEEEEENGGTKTKRKKKKVKRYGKGQVFDELANREGAEVTLRIDSNLLAEAESENPNANRKQAAEELRRTVATIGKPGEPGEKVRCVVSVNMLSEGWDANNVTHILGLRAFGSQLLCEQVVGRGLRRLDYTPDPETGFLTPEYVDIFGVPFSLIPFKGKQPGKGPAPEDRPKNEVKALPERKGFEIRFPVVEGYAIALKKNIIKCNVAETEPTRIDPFNVPTAAFIRPQVGYQIGNVSAYGGFGVELVDREEYYASTHPQAIEFEIARRIVHELTQAAHPGKESLRRQSRHALFPQVLRTVQEYVRTRVDNPAHIDPCEIGLKTYAERIVSLLLDAIQPDDTQGEAPLLPRLNRYKPICSTTSVHFKTVKPVVATQKSHINYVACDTNSWEQAAMFQLESSPHVKFYARNDRLEFNIPYELYDQQHAYEPDFLVKLTNGITLILEIKGQLHIETEAKHQAAKRWVSAVNNWKKLGRWEFMVCHNPQKLGSMISGCCR